MFRLTKKEKQELVTNCERLQALKHSPTPPRVFTEQGVAMLSSVLRSDRAGCAYMPVLNAFKLKEITKLQICGASRKPDLGVGTDILGRFFNVRLKGI